VTSASTIRREEYEDLTEQMLKFEDDVTLQMEMQVNLNEHLNNFKRSNKSRMNY